MSLLGSLLYGLAHVLHPRMLWLMLWPMLVAAGFWLAIAAALWTRSAIKLAELLKQWLESAVFFIHLDAGGATLVVAQVLMFLLFVPLVLLTALVILSLFGMQQMVDHVAEGSFPGLERRHGGSGAGNAWNALVALAGMAGLGLVSIPLWLFPPLWPVMPVAILAWVNQRLLRYDALAAHADREEMARLCRERRGALYVLGLLLAVAAYVPVIGFFAPVVLGLAFIHYLLGALERDYRRNPDKSLDRQQTPS